MNKQELQQFVDQKAKDILLSFNELNEKKVEEMPMMAIVAVRRKNGELTENVIPVTDIDHRFDFMGHIAQTFRMMASESGRNEMARRMEEVGEKLGVEVPKTLIESTNRAMEDARAVEAIIILSETWVAKGKQGEPEIRPSQLPESQRKEMLMVAGMNSQREIEMQMYDIERNGNGRVAKQTKIADEIQGSESPLLEEFWKNYNTIRFTPSGAPLLGEAHEA